MLFSIVDASLPIAKTESTAATSATTTAASTDKTPGEKNGGTEVEQEASKEVEIEEVDPDLVLDGELGRYLLSEEEQRKR